MAHTSCSPSLTWLFSYNRMSKSVLLRYWDIVHPSNQEKQSLAVTHSFYEVLITVYCLYRLYENRTYMSLHYVCIKCNCCVYICCGTHFPVSFLLWNNLNVAVKVCLSAMQSCCASGLPVKLCSLEGDMTGRSLYILFKSCWSGFVQIVLVCWHY